MLGFLGGFLNSCILQKLNVTPQSKRYTAEFWYILSLEIDSYKSLYSNAKLIEFCKNACIFNSNKRIVHIYNS